MQSNGTRIAQNRSMLGWTQRKLGSKVGLTLREMRAVETDREPTPRRERRIIVRRDVPELGYAINIVTNSAVRDMKFNLLEQQDRVLNYLRDLPEGEWI